MGLQCGGGLPLVFDRLEDLASCPEVDAVYIASPTGCHYDQARQMLLAGKHVLCEKPAVVTARQLRELLAIAREKGVVFLEAMRLVHDDALDVIRAALPEIGPLRRVTFEFTQYSSRYDRIRAGEQGINAFDPALSNGGIMDLGCYCLHAIAALFGAPRRVRADCVRLSNGFDGGGIILLGSFSAKGRSRASPFRGWSQIRRIWLRSSTRMDPSSPISVVGAACREILE